MSFNVREATPTDLDELLRLYEERMDVYLKFERRTPSFAESRTAWQAAITDWLEREDMAVMVAVRGDGLIGYMVGWRPTDTPLSVSQKLGLVTEMSVDGHCKQGGVGSAMFKALGDWFRKQGIDAVEVRLLRQNPIEQAFWRSIGGQPFIDQLSVRLDEGTR